MLKKFILSIVLLCGANTANSMTPKEALRNFTIASSLPIIMKGFFLQPISKKFVTQTLLLSAIMNYSDYKYENSNFGHHLRNIFEGAVKISLMIYVEILMNIVNQFSNKILKMDISNYTKFIWFLSTMKINNTSMAFQLIGKSFLFIVLYDLYRDNSLI